MRNRAGWLALSVLVVATLLMVFFVMPRISDDKKSAGDAGGTAGNTSVEASSENGAPSSDKAPDSAASPTDKAAETATAAPAAGEAQSGTEAPQQQAAVTPTFDVLRVEPDGSTVIAGHAAPGSTVEVSAGDTVIASTTAGTSGDFAIVLENPLPAGDYQLALKATSTDGRTSVSEETATVSVPQDAGGKLLAMVTKPGKASRLIAVPEADQAAGAEEAAGKEVAQAITETAAETPPQSESASQTAGQDGQAEIANATTILPEMPDAASDLVASAPPIPLADPTPDAPVAAAELQVTAVEIEGNRIFVAGRAEPGASLRGLADEQMIGTTTTAADGHFIIEGSMDLSVGDHMISVEKLDDAGQAQVRVAVSFNRPPGEQVAAVAGAPDAVSPIDAGAFDRLRNQVDQAFTLLEGLYADNREPTAEELAAARSATGFALKSLSEYRLPAGASASATEIVETTSRQAAETFSALEKLPSDVKSVGGGLAEIADLLGRTVGPEMTTAPPDGTVPAGDTEPTNDVTAVNSETPVKTIEQAPLTESHNSVIIRRGDTLWQISRRVYGQGVRYTTIYLANQDQISNPDLIEPGQIFGVPDKALPNAEEFHRKRMQKQLR